MIRTPQNYNPLQGLFRVLIFLVILAYLLAAFRLWLDTREETRDRLEHIESMLVQGVRATLKSHEMVLSGLGGELISQGALEDPEKGRALIERMKAIDSGMAAFGFARPDGQLMLVSGVPPSQALPNLALGEKTGKSFQQAMQTGKLRVGRPYLFPPLGGWVVPVRVPVTDAQGDPKALMVAAYAIAGGTTFWAQLSLPPEVFISLVLDDGYLMYRQPLLGQGEDGAIERTYSKPMAQQTLARWRALPDEQNYLEMPLPSVGGDYYVAHARLPEYGMQAIAAIDRSALVIDWLRRLLVPTGLLLVFVLTGSLAYRHALRQHLQASDEVNALSAWQQAVLDGAEYSIISTDITGKVVSFNRAAQRMLGYRPEEVIGKFGPMEFHVASEVRQRATELRERLGEELRTGFDVFVAEARHGLSGEHVWTYVRKDRSRFPVALSISPLIDTDQSCIGYIGIAVDLSERQAMLADLRDSEDRYRTLFENSSDTLFLMKDGVLVDCNPAALQMFACSREQLVGASLFDHSPRMQLDGRLSRNMLSEKLEAAQSGEMPFFEWQLVRADGELFEAELTLSAIQLMGQPHYLGTARDISDRKRSEAELLQSREALLSTNERLSLLNLLLQRLHGSLSQQEVLNETLQAIEDMGVTQRSAIYLYDTRAKLLRVAASRGFEEQAIAKAGNLPLQGTLTGMALSSGKAMTSDSIRVDKRIIPEVRKVLLDAGAHSAVVVPMLSGEGEPLGVLALVSDRAFGYSEEMVETLESIGNSVALAITNARHLDSLAFQASHDGLTGLPNRIFLHKRFQQQVGVAGGAVNSGSALLLLDLDHFKDVNDTLGHHVGDDILIQTGMRLREVGEQYKALVCRLGGDEFALLMYTFGNRARVDELARELGDSLRQPFNVEGYEIRVGVSIGIACYPDDGEDSHSLMRAADVAMYQAKRLPQVSVRYDSKFDQYSTERLALANELVQAVQEMQLVMHYQPKVDVANGETVGLEALVRWQHPRLGLLYPGSFIDLVEVGEVVQSFTNAVIRLAVADKKRLHDLGFNQPVSINLSTRNLLDTACLTTFDQVIAEHQLPAWELEVELTETVLMQDPTLAAKLLGRFNDRGIKAVVDDFGTGYSSLAYLRMLPIAALKIDRSFVTDMVINQQDQTIVRSTIGLAHNLGLSVVAEGVEDADTMSMLRGMQCDLAQGFGLCKPLPLEKLIPWLQEHSRGDAQTRVSDAS